MGNLKIATVVPLEAAPASSAGVDFDLPDFVVLEGQEYRPLYFWTKRLVDILVSAILLVLALPVFLLIAILIKLDSPGPVIFVQERVGAIRYVSRRKIHWRLRTFRFLKFRSMVQNADPAWHKAFVRAFCSGNSPKLGSSSFRKSDDSRVTRFGKILRKGSLDELPQLLNVLRGEMSLIGPRPVPVYEVALYGDAQLKRLAAVPGITGLWQVGGRCRVPFKEMVGMDIHYARKASLWLDVKILLRTIPAVFRAHGAE
jgi:lipopolysaccharide/colanic/teichoic acid biosynthesis glycosyltransferase